MQYFFNIINYIIIDYMVINYINIITRIIK